MQKDRSPDVMDVEASLQHSIFSVEYTPRN